jgi:uncharacterized membrane protein
MHVFRFATVQGQNIHWFLKRNCSVTPAQLGGLYASLCVVSLGIAAAFWFQGAMLIRRRVNVGRYLRPELRPLLAQEIRRALREARG